MTVNTPAERDLAAEAVVAAGLPLRRDLAPAMTGEDFAWYLDSVPAPSSGSATARQMADASCTTRATTTTTRSCRRHRAIWPVSPGGSGNLMTQDGQVSSGMSLYG